MKKVLVLAALVSLLTAGNVFAHDAGDLMMHIEPQFGLSIPSFTIAMPFVNKVDTKAIGAEFGLTVSVHYWFLDFLGANIGLGFNMGFDWATGERSTYSDYNSVTFITRAHLTVPFGVRFNMGAFVAGGGLSLNNPLGNALFVTSVEGSSGNNDSGNFDLQTYLGWYFDIGFDTSGNKNKRSGFGMALRLAGSFGDIDKEEYYSYRAFSISLVLSPAIQMANFMRKGRTESVSNDVSNDVSDE